MKFLGDRSALTRRDRRQVLATSPCETHGIDPVFMRGAYVSRRPNVAICLTAPEHARVGGKPARSGSTRSYAPHTVRTLRPASLTGVPMLRPTLTRPPARLSVT